MNFQRCVVLMCSAIVLCACVTAKPVYGPDGQQAHAISCSESIGIDWSDCFERAGQICGTRGYKIWNQASSESSLISGDSDFLIGGTSESRTLLISCQAERQAEAPHAEIPAVVADQ